MFICSNKIDYKDAFIKNRFNCKQTGKLLGLIHKDCKERINKTKEITVAFHNGSKYDFELVLNQIAKDFEGSISFIARRKETYLSFSTDYLKKEKVRIKFIDTSKHTQASIELLSNNLSNGFYKKILSENCKKNIYIYYSDQYKYHECRKIINKKT